MNVAILDLFANASDFAQRMDSSENDIEDIYLISNHVSPTIWSRGKLQVVEGISSVEQVVNFLQQKNISLLVNFNSLLGYAGVLEKAKELGVKTFGASLEFSKTEINKREFKDWLKKNNFRTPEIYFMGLMKDVRSKAGSFTYPLVIKPDIQCGPKTVICHSDSELIGYLEETARLLSFTELSILFVVEQFVDADYILGIEYYISNGNGFPVYSAACAYGAKSDRNITGAAWGYSPYPELLPHQEEINRLIQLLASFTHAGVGTFQAIIDKEGQLQVLENNARPTACRIWRELADPILAIQHLINGKVDSIHDSQAFNATNGHMLSVLLVQDHDEIPIELSLPLQLDGVQLTPHSMKLKNKQMTSIKGKPPSVLTIYGDNWFEISSKLKSAAKIDGMGIFELSKIETEINDLHNKSPS